MNTETMFRVKTEPFDMPPDPMTRTYSSLANLTPLNNYQFNECLEYSKDQADYAYSPNVCYVCGLGPIYGKRYCCLHCRKVFHESCRNNAELASSTGRWQCLDCKWLEKRCSASFTPRIENVMTMVNDKNFQMPAINAEKNDKNDGNNCGSDECDLVECKSANCNIVAVPSALDKPSDVPTVDQKPMDNTDEIIDKVAKGLFMKQNDTMKKNICNRFGPIPGIPVGTCWKYRLQVSQCGIHGPLVAGIQGRFNEGACSIVLSGVYPEDEDFGDEFYYSGCGGRDRGDPHKRLKVQTQHQTLTRLNRALALSCNAVLNDTYGAESSDWQGGKPVRVIRNYKLRKHSIYAPIEGNRYDGIYKVVKYFPAIGHTGLLVWRYLLRRDDPEPAPWTEEGKRIIEEKNLRVIFPYAHENNQSAIKREVDGPPVKKQFTVKSEIVERSPLKKIAYNYNDVNLAVKMEPYDPSYLQSYPPSNYMPAPDLFHEEVDIKPNGDVLRPAPSYNYNYSWYKPPAKIQAPVDVPVQSAPSFQLNVSSVRSLNPNASGGSATTPAAVSNPVSQLNVPTNDVPSNPTPANNVPSLLQPTNNNNFGVITIKEEAYELSESAEKLIDSDTANETLWIYCKTFLGKSEKEFLGKVRMMFFCRSCCNIVNRPVTTPCDHNICLKCITNHFSQSQFSCPDCSYYLSPNFNPTVNENLAGALEKLFSA